MPSPFLRFMPNRVYGNLHGARAPLALGQSRPEVKPGRLPLFSGKGGHVHQLGLIPSRAYGRRGSARRKPDGNNTEKRIR